MEGPSSSNETLLTSETEQVFTGKIDRFKGVTVTSSDEPDLNKEELSKKLKYSIRKWKNEVNPSKYINASWCQFRR